MATIKSYTDLEQSKKLADILPLESSDMCWTNHYYGSLRSSMTISAKSIDEYKNLLKNFADSTETDMFYPAWSLASLLNVIPKEIFNGKYVINITEGKYNKWIITYDSGYSDSFYGLIASDNNLVDACVYIIERAHKLNLL